MKLALLLSLLFSLSAFGADRCPTQADWNILAPAEDNRDFVVIKKLVNSGMSPELCRNYENLLGWATDIYGEMWDAGRLDEVRDFIDFLLKRGVDINKGMIGWDPIKKLGSSRPIDHLTSVCATDLVYRLIKMGAEFKRPYKYERFYSRTVLSHTKDCRELADYYLNKQNLPVLDQDICNAFKEARNSWNEDYDRRLRDAGFSGQALPVFIQKIKDVYGWDVPYVYDGNSHRPEEKHCFKLLDEGLPPLPNP